jgi:trimethylamine--corrinoid protein Co-methyltransferase
MKNRRAGNRRATRLQEAQTLSPLADKPFRCLQNRFQPLEPLSPDKLEQIHDASMRIVEEIGIDFLDREVLALWQSAGAKVDFASQHVWIEPELLLSLVRQAPARFNLRCERAMKNIRSPLEPTTSISLPLAARRFILIWIAAGGQDRWSPSSAWFG